MTELAKGAVGHFMLGVGAIIEHEPTGTILLMKRAEADFQIGVWEMMYGRLDHFEEVSTGLKREVFEELGITDIQVGRLLRVWHFYRGEKTQEKEIYGFTFHCTVSSQEVILNPEHDEYEWVTPEKALEKVTVTGLKRDLEVYLQYKKGNLENKTAFSNVNEELSYL